MNFSTFIVLIVVIGIVLLAIRSMINDKKSGKASCGGNCGGCGNNSLCHDSKLLFEEYRKNRNK